MTTPYTVRPPNPFARRAGLWLLVLAALALFMGVCAIAICISYPTLMQDPAFAERTNELNRQTGGEVRLAAGVFGAMLLIYAVAGIVLGLLVRSANFVVIIITMVLTAGLILFMAVNLIVGIARGDAGGMLFATLLIAAHGAIVKQLVEALRFSSKSAITYAAPPAYRPMQAYYLPPIQPAAR